MIIFLYFCLLFSFFACLLGERCLLLCVQEWYQDPISSRLVRNTTLAHTPLPDTILIMANHTSLQDKSTQFGLPSCILLPEANGNNFELKPQFINTLPRFHGLESEDTYFFICEFEEVCLMMRISQLGKDVVRLRFIPFALKDMAKKWLYNLPVSSISSWDDFVKAFLKKFYPINKMALIRKNIMQFKQETSEPFWKYFELLA